jgi:hypothetical protein
VVGYKDRERQPRNLDKQSHLHHRGDQFRLPFEGQLGFIRLPVVPAPDNDEAERCAQDLV